MLENKTSPYQKGDLPNPSILAITKIFTQLLKIQAKPHQLVVNTQQLILMEKIMNQRQTKIMISTQQTPKMIIKTLMIRRRRIIRRRVRHTTILISINQLLMMMMVVVRTKRHRHQPAIKQRKMIRHRVKHITILISINRILMMMVTTTKQHRYQQMIKRHPINLPITKRMPMR